MGIAGLILGLGLLVATGLSQQLESTERNLTSNVEIIPGNPTNDSNSQITNAFTYSNDSGATNAPTISIPTSPQDFSSDREGGESEKEVSANGDTKLIGSGATNTNYTRQGGIFQLLFGGPRLCNCPCGRSNTITRILGGEFVQVNEFPWLVLINVRGIVSFGGVLLNDRYVVTAASQLVGLTPFDVKVTLGEHDRCYPDVSTVNMSVEFIRLHQEYDPLTKSHDIALLRLSNSVTFEKRISPICLPVVGTDYTDQVAILVGWGEGPNAEGGVVSTCRPRKLGLPILSERECLVSNYEPGLVTRDKGCAGVLGGQSVVCSTDAGGPVQFKTLRGIYELIGVLSDVNVCNQNSSPALFTRIDFFMDWIIEYTRDSCYCTK